MKDVLPASFTQNAPPGRNDGLTAELSQVPRQSLQKVYDGHQPGKTTIEPTKQSGSDYQNNETHAANMDQSGEVNRSDL